jgi:HTH-type transcriptional regulator/antitoxin HigA
MERVWTAFRSEKEYDIALERMIQIFHAEQGTPESDELQSLLPLVMEYEDIHYPIPAPGGNKG